MTKIIKIEEIKIISFERNDEFQENFHKKMWDMVLKVAKIQSFTLSLDCIFFEIYT